MDFKSTGANAMCCWSSASLDVSCLNSELYAIVLASRRRGFSQYRAGVALSLSSPSTAMVVAQPVALEFSPTGIGKC